jgi:hypothetical protein
MTTFSGLAENVYDFYFAQTVNSISIGSLVANFIGYNSITANIGASGSIAFGSGSIVASMDASYTV